MTTQRSLTEIRDFHAFVGAGGGKAGFGDARPVMAGLEGYFRYIGGIDVDTRAVQTADRVFPRECPSTVMDLFDRDQYTAFHGKPPPQDWCEATPADIQRAAHNEAPNVVFLSAPCKGFSGLMSENRSLTDKYQALNRLAERAMWLMLEAWADDPAEFYLFENVPRIATRGRAMLDRITALLNHYGYVDRETVHDCGEIGGLHQSRKRFLKVSRHAAKVPSHLYEPIRRPLRPVGELLERMRLPGDVAAGPMHRIPNLSWKTWVRLAFVEPGKDWRSLNRLAVEDGHLRDYLIVPAGPDDWHAGVLGVSRWDQPSGTVTGSNRPCNGRFSVADPRAAVGAEQYQQYGVLRWQEASGAVIGVKSPGQGRYSVADPRPGLRRQPGDAYVSAGHYGVTAWDAATGAVSAAAQHDNGRWSVADPRLPAATDKVQAVIRSLDGSWHRPFTTLELAALQGLFDPDDDQLFTMDSGTDSAAREHIGNMVPRHAATAIAAEIGRAILLTRTGQTFRLSATPVWVRPVAIAIALDGGAL